MTNHGLRATAHVGHLYLSLANPGYADIARSLQLYTWNLHASVNLCHAGIILDVQNGDISSTTLHTGYSAMETSYDKSISHISVQRDSGIEVANLSNGNCGTHGPTRAGR